MKLIARSGLLRTAFRNTRTPIGILALVAIALACSTGTTSAPAASQYGPWSDKVVIVGVDLPSDRTLGRFPYSRSAYARLVDKLSAAGAAVVAFDIAFDLARDPSGDDAFHESLVASKVPIILGYGAAGLKGGNGFYMMTGEDQLPNWRFRCADPACSSPIPAIHLASTQALMDDRNVVTQVPMVIVPRCRALATCAVAHLAPLSYSAYALQTGAPLALAPATKQVNSPTWSQPLSVDSRGAATVRFAGHPGDFERHGQYFSLGAVLDGSVPLSRFKDKVVVVGGYHHPGAVDERLTPTSSEKMASVEIHANVIAMFLSQSWVRVSK